MIEPAADEFSPQNAPPLGPLAAEGGSLEALMEAVREHLGLQAAYVSAAAGIERERAAAAALASIRAPIEAVISDDRLRIVYQPIWRIGQARPIGFEALARFPAVNAEQPGRSPDQWFHDAALVGCGEVLEVLAIDRALAALPQLPEDIYLTVNVSPLTAHSLTLQNILRRYDLKRIVLEITEHEAVEDVLALRAALAGLRADGLRLAVDDAGAGFSGLQQILQLQPDIIKLDRFFVSGIDTDPSRRALAAALAEFSNQVGSIIIAEGVEVEAELETLRSLGFRIIQGYLLGRPQPLAQLLPLVL